MSQNVSTPFQPIANSSTSQGMLDGDSSRNESLDCDKTTDPNDKECDAIDLEDGEQEEGNEKKRAKTSSVWLEFKEIVLPDGSRKGECVHCKRKLAISASKSTTQFKRHLSTCLRRKVFQNQQQRINFQPVEAGSSSNVEMLPALTNGKFDMAKMREAAC